MKKNSISEYFSWLLQQYQEIRAQIRVRSNYRLVGVANADGRFEEMKLQVQIVGKVTVLQIQPSEIVKNNAFLEGFSKKDIRVITYYATIEEQNPKYHILSQNIGAQEDSHSFKLFSSEDGAPINKTPREIAKNNEIVMKLCQEDAHKVGYACADEQAAVEKRELKRFNDQILKYERDLYESRRDC